MSNMLITIKHPQGHVKEVKAMLVGGYQRCSGEKRDIVLVVKKEEIERINEDCEVESFTFTDSKGNERCGKKIKMINIGDIISGKSKPKNDRWVLTGRYNHYHTLYSIDGQVARDKGLFRSVTAEERFFSCGEGETWRYRNKKFRKMTTEELKQYADKEYTFSMAFF